MDGLENMYSEVLKLLGLKKYGRPAQGSLGEAKGSFPGNFNLPSPNMVQLIQPLFALRSTLKTIWKHELFTISELHWKQASLQRGSETLSP